MTPTKAQTLAALLSLIPIFSSCSLLESDDNEIASMLSASEQRESEELALFRMLKQIEQKNLTHEQMEAVNDVRRSIIQTSWSLASIATETGLASVAPGAGPDDSVIVSQESGITIQVIDGPANIRSRPSTDSPRFMLVPTGFVLRAISKIESWYQVMISGQVGFIHRNLVKETESLRDEPDPLAPGTGDLEEVNSLEQASENFTDRFRGLWSFGCLDEHQKCRTKHAWYDCDLIMLSCIGESWLRAF